MLQRTSLSELPNALFWDADPTSLDMGKHWRFIICRVLRFGTACEVRWILENFSEEQIRTVVSESRELDRKTASFWAVHFGIPTSEIRCLHQPFLTV